MQFRSIQHYHQALLNGHTSCEEMVHLFLQKIQQSSHLNAMVHVYAEESLHRARLLDISRQKSGIKEKLHGVVFTLKDTVSYKGHPLTAGSAMLQNYTAVFNATIVERLLQAGAIIIGSANCDEFSMGSTNETSVYGGVKNAIDTRRVSGGSSGGSAVAVQAGLCMVSIGSDTGGSVRQPADYCGITGFKPSYGAISRYGLIAYASSFEQAGIFTRHPEDLYPVWDVLAGPDGKDSTVHPVDNEEIQASPYKVGLLKNLLDHPLLDTAIRDRINQFAVELNQNNRVEEVNMPLSEYLIPAYYTLTAIEAASNMARYDGIRYGFNTTETVSSTTGFVKKNRTEGFGRKVKKRILLGNLLLMERYKTDYVQKANCVREKLKADLSALLETVDFLILPCVTRTAPFAGSSSKGVEEDYEADIFTVIANLAGMPAISVPLFTHPNGMPFGLQVLTKKNNDVSLLAFSSYLVNSYKSKSGG